MNKELTPMVSETWWAVKADANDAIKRSVRCFIDDDADRDIWLPIYHSVFKTIWSPVWSDLDLRTE